MDSFKDNLLSTTRLPDANIFKDFSKYIKIKIKIEIDKAIRKSSLTNSWTNRNALHVDTTGEVSRIKLLIVNIANAFLGIKDESKAGEARKRMSLLPTDVEYFGLFGVNENTRPTFVHISDKDVYLLSRKEYILGRINYFFASNLRNIMEMREENYFGDEDRKELIYLMKIGYIKKSDLILIIKENIKLIGLGIIKKITGSIGVSSTNNDGSETELGRVPLYVYHLQLEEKRFFAYCLQEGFFSPVQLKQISSIYDHGEYSNHYIGNYGGDLPEEYYKKLIS